MIFIGRPSGLTREQMIVSHRVEHYIVPIDLCGCINTLPPDVVEVLGRDHRKIIDTAVAVWQYVGYNLLVEAKQALDEMLYDEKGAAFATNEQFNDAAEQAFGAVLWLTGLMAPALRLAIARGNAPGGRQWVGGEVDRLLDDHSVVLAMYYEPG